MRSRYPVLLLTLACVLAAYCGRPVAPPATTQAGAPAPTATPTPSPMPTLSPTLTATPIAVQIVNSPATPTPVSPWPPEVEKAVSTLRALWQRFRWWVIPIVLLALVVYAISKVGAELLKKWIEQVAAWLNDRLKNLVAKLRRGPNAQERALLEDILDRYEHLEMKGFVREKVMTASLESVYVPLFTQAAGAGGAPGVSGAPGGLLVRETAGEPTPLTALLPRHRCLVLTGEAGSGKSTFLRYVALALARALVGRAPALVRQRLDWEVDPLPLPILLPLGGFGLYLQGLPDADKESPNPGLLLGYMRHHLRDLELPEGFIEDRLERDCRCLVLGRRVGCQQGQHG